MSSLRITQWKELFNDSLKASRTPKERKGRIESRGAKTNLPINRWFALVFEYNELRSVQQLISPDIQPLTDEQILYNFKLEYGNRRKVKFGDGTKQPGGAILSGKHGIGFTRNKYNKGILYAGQYKPIMVSFRFNKDSKLIDDRLGYKYPTFRECQQKCIHFKIADPRFFTLEDMEKMHQYALSQGDQSLWSFPAKHELDEIAQLVPVVLYRSILTYDIWKSSKGLRNKDDTLKTKIDEINFRDKKREKENEDELKLLRKETKKILDCLVTDKEELDEATKEENPFDEDHGYGFPDLEKNNI